MSLLCTSDPAHVGSQIHDLGGASHRLQDVRVLRLFGLDEKRIAFLVLGTYSFTPSWFGVPDFLDLQLFLHPLPLDFRPSGVLPLVHPTLWLLRA